MFSGQEERTEKKGAKQTVNPKAGTERRQRQLMSVRHKVHGELMKHLRSEPKGNEEGDAIGEEGGSAVMDPWHYNGQSAPEKVPVALLPQLVNMVNTGSMEEVQQGMLLIRKLLSVDKNPPYEKVLESGVVPRLVELLSVDTMPQLQFEVAWALTNLAAGTSDTTLSVINYGAIPPLVALMYSPNVDCRDQACWALGNLAGENLKCCQQVIDAGAFNGLLHVLSLPDQPIFMLRNVVWALSNVCRYRAKIEPDVVHAVLNTVASLLNHHDEQVVVDALWTISYISDGSQERVQAVIDVGVLPRVVELLAMPAAQTKMPAIRTIGNLAAGTDEQTQCIINSGALPLICDLLHNPKRALRKETCWTVSNIAAGQSYQVDALINANIFPSLLECMSAPELDVKKEAVWAVANVTFCGTVEQMRFLVGIGTIPTLCDTLQTYDPKVVTIALEALQLFLQLGEDDKRAGITDSNAVAQQMMQCGAVTVLENLQAHQSPDVYNLTFQILSNYFATEDSMPVMGDESEAMQGAFSGDPSTNNGNGFQL